MNASHRSAHLPIALLACLGVAALPDLGRAQCPAVREAHVAIYDPGVTAAGPRMVIFGGKDFSTFHSDVWTLTLPTSGTPTWAQAPASPLTPPAPVEGTAVYDPVWQQLLYFGGAASNGLLSNQVWRMPLANLTWELVSTNAGPSPRQKHTAIYDPVRSKMVIFGGADAGGTLLQEAWELTMSGPSVGTWALVSTTGAPPAARADHTSVYDTEFNRMVISGGAPQKNTMVLTLPASGPKVWSQPWVGYWNQRSGQSMTWDPFWNRMLAWGGTPFNAGSTNLVVMANYQGDPTTYSYQAYSLLYGTPPMRRNHTQIFDAANRRIVIFGGHLDAVGPPAYSINYNDTHALPISEWNLYPAQWSPLTTCGTSEPGMTYEAEPSTEAPLGLRLLGANPFATSTRLAFTTPTAARVQLEVFDVAGRRVATLAEGEYPAGEHVIEWDGRVSGSRARPGIYLARMQVGARWFEKTLVLQP